MIYPQRDNRRKRRKTAVATGIVGGVLVLAVVLNIWKPHILTPALQTAGGPVLAARGGIGGGFDAVWNYFHFKASLVAENQALKDKLALSDAIKTERDFYKDQNAALEKLATSTTADRKFAIARIISKPGFSPYDTMIVDAGKTAGIKIGDLVLADENSVLGTVSDVSERTSTVVLYSSPDRETPVLIGSSSVESLATGHGAGNFEIKLPKNTQVKEGDTVSLASSTSVMMLGSIEVINASAVDSFERALFKNAADVTALGYVMIEKK